MFLFFLLKEAHFVSISYRLHLVAHPVGNGEHLASVKRVLGKIAQAVTHSTLKYVSSVAFEQATPLYGKESPTLESPFLRANSTRLRLFMEYWSLQHHELQQVSTDDYLTYAAMVCSSAHDDTRISVALFRHLLERRCMILLFDGLDEVTGLRERQALVTAIEDFASRYPGNAILVTSRPAGYALARFSEHVFTHAEILAFDDKQIKQLVEHLYQYLVQKPDLSEQDESDIDTILKRLSEPGLRRLAVNPLLLTVMSILSRARGIADRRGDIYEACARLLLSKWASLKGTDERWKDVQLGQEEQYACIAHLGLVLHEHMQERTGTADVPAAFLQTEVERFLSNQHSLTGGTREDLHSQATLFLDMMNEETGLIIQSGTGESDLPLYGFIHRTFQEYFAAVAVYNRYWQERAEEPHQLDDFITQHLHSAHWREVILLLLAKFPPESATARLQTILDSKSSFHSILKQDLFFVCDCLLDEIIAEDALAQRVIAELRDVIKSSPFYTQQREAITYLVSLLQTRDYARLAGGALIACLIEDSPLSVRLQVAQNLYMHASQDSQECQQAHFTPLCWRRSNTTVIPLTLLTSFCSCTSTALRILNTGSAHSIYSCLTLNVLSSLQSNYGSSRTF